MIGAALFLQPLFPCQQWLAAVHISSSRVFTLPAGLRSLDLLPFPLLNQFFFLHLACTLCQARVLTHLGRPEPYPMCIFFMIL